MGPRTLLAQSILAAGLLSAFPAFAQSATDQTASSPQSTRPQRAASPRAAAKSAASSITQLAGVTVTANKRPEDVAKVDSAVSVVTGESLILQQATQLADYVANMPGVTVNTLGSAGQASITIRGIPPLTNGSKVATYINDAPLGSSGIWGAQSTFQLDLLPFDLDKIEVFRGPQGTLYGASSMGGLLKYDLLEPDTEKLEAEVGVDTSAVNGAGQLGKTVQGRVNLPIKEDVLGLSLSAFSDTTPGYIDNTYGGQTHVNSSARSGGRIAVSFIPSDTLTIDLNALTQHTHSSDDATISLLNPSQTTQPDGSILVSGGTKLGSLTENKAFLAPFDSTVDLYSANIEWNPGPFDFVSTTSSSHNDIVHVADNSISYGSYYPLFGLPPGLARSALDLKLSKFTQEFRVSTPTDEPFSGLLGVFYTNENATNDQLVSAFDTSYQPISALQPYAGYAHIPTRYTEYATFANAVWNVSPKFALSAGVRYSINEQRFDVTGSGVLLGLPQTPPTALPTVNSKDDNTTYKVSGKYQLTNSVMIYARVATGYAPGGANTPYPGAPRSVGAETLTSYEAGIKSHFYDNKLLLNLTGYHIAWNNIQLPAVINNVAYTENGGRASSNGVELSSVVSPVRNLSVELSAAYTDAELKSVAANVSTPFVLNTQLLLVPKATATISTNYSWSVGKWAAQIGATIRWVDKEYGVEKVVGQPYFILPSSTLVNLDASVTKGPVTFRAYVRNLTNKLAPTTGFLNTDVTGNTLQTDLAITQPRTIGVGVIYKF